jgi:hypothetical protein
MDMRICFLLLGWVLIISAKSVAQKSALFEIGFTYLTNNLPDSTNLNDFGAFSFNTRYLITKKENSAIALEALVSFTAKLYKGKTVLIGVQIPLLLTYSSGAGSSDNVSDKKMGYTIGAGVSWFYQQAKSKRDELPVYSESLSQLGPIVKGGFRFPIKSLTLFKANGKDVHPSLAVNILHQFNLSDTKKNIGSVSLMLGITF